MRPHHTKTKGDLGILHALLREVELGFGILVPMTEHEAFDLVAYRGERFFRVQVKYRALTNGCVSVPFKTSWADRHGVHSVAVDKSSIELLCIYCPETDRCYYVDPTRFGAIVVLRVTALRNGQRKGIAWADDYLQVPAGVLGVPPASSSRLEDEPDIGQSAPPNRRP